MTFCKVCGKLLPNVRFDPTEVTICQKCADRMEEDLVRVVRCKDCKHYDAFSQQCERIDGILLPDFFCADGEKAQE